jgi:hypothetical protein
MWKPWLWRPASQAVALRNARNASAVLAQRRLEREEVDAFLAVDRGDLIRRPHSRAG